MYEGGVSNTQNPEALIQAVISRIEQRQASQTSRPPQPEHRQPISHLTAPVAGGTNFQVIADPGSEEPTSAEQKATYLPTLSAYNI